MPKRYTKENVIDLLKKYYPHEWESVKIKYDYYTIKDRHINKHKKRTRYNMQNPTSLIKNASLFKKITNKDYQEQHYKKYDEIYKQKMENQLWNKRFPKIDRINKKINKALLKTQQMYPSFLDKLIGFYERKNTSQNDRMYILIELKKYYSNKTIQFFFKLNDTELNRQLRENAFYHLQSFNYQPRLRRQKYMQIHTKNKKRKEFLKNYANECCQIEGTPQELEYRINNAKEQKIKEYDFFISHSYLDSEEIQKLITYENENNKNVFCDWICDNDYLKRKLLCEETLKVLEKRMEQSKEMIFVESDNSKKSRWCKYELNYFYNLKKPIYTIPKYFIQSGNFKIKKMDDLWFIEENFNLLNYRKSLLLNSCNCQVKTFTQ
ncbi:toll/interleukin-1 receptor domain-containing protein [Campylobacter jejuni]|uniref:toll/interleukin-1 receptor domain-containing protein n=1 Tax=Campylobacter jejuni TaxID=197 RepID=UPI00202A5DBF|nr:toll/interleukin-1 receptor domain-containing protein [Campylobacter jejuni]WHV03828.1 TIR domain-containing protein [Campylobacter jejuni]